MPKIENIRRSFDPACRFIVPHITLVFPFNSPISDLDLKLWIEQAIKGFRPIEFQLGAPMYINSYAFLPVTQGRERIVELHDRLYTGELSHLLAETECPYIPHVTIGRFCDLSESRQIAEECLDLDFTGVGFTPKLYLETILSELGLARIEAEMRL